MAEKRMISKVISISKKFNVSLNDHFSRLLYVLLIPHSDDFGRLTGDSFKVKALILPMMIDVEWEEVEKSLKKLHQAELINWFEADGEKYIQIINFDKHQSGLHKRTKSKFPDPPNYSRKFPEIPPEGKGREENGIEENGTEGSPRPDLRRDVQNLLEASQVEDYTIHHIEIISSYYGVVDYEVIEYAIAKSKKKHVNYTVRTIEGLVRDGKTTKESVKYIHAVPDKPKYDPELESRYIEIARNKWISEGNDPSGFVYKPASGS